jgi:glyoxylate reductase
MPRGELLERVAGKAGMMAMLTDRVDDELLERAGPGLRVVANFAVGFDNLDLEACTARGVLATNTPDVVTEATADLAWALLLAAARRVAEGDRFLRGQMPWIWGPEFFLGFEVHGKTLGVIGLGRIGQAVARRAAGFGMPVLYTARRRLDPGREAVLGVAWRELDQLLAEADFVSIHTGLSPATHRLIGAERLARMKPTAVLVNTAAARSWTRPPWPRPCGPAGRARPAWTCSSASPRSIRPCWSWTTSSSCPTWARRPWRPGWPWA